MKNGNRAAHPLPGEVMVDDSYEHSIIDGLTKREHFAGLAMQGLAANYGNGSHKDMAASAVKMANELLKALGE